MQHDMPQSLLVFAVTLTPETPNFETFGESRTPLENFFNILKNFVFLSVYMHIFEIEIMKKKLIVNVR